MSSRDEIFELSPAERLVHLAFRPANKDIFGLVETCPKIEVIQVPPSYVRSISKSIAMFLEMQKISLIEGEVWGHRKDLNEYYSVPAKIFSTLKEMGGERLDKVEAELVGKHRISKGLFEYIITKGIEA